MRTLGPALLLLGSLLAGWHAAGQAARDRKPAPKFTLDRETTYFTGPLDRDGYVDYEAALNERLHRGIRPKDNANVLIWKVLGAKPEGTEIPADYFRYLGTTPPPETGDYFVSFGAYLKDHVALDQKEWNAVVDQLDRASVRVWRGKDYPHVAGWLKVNEKPLELLIEASKRPEYFNPLVARKTAKGSDGLITALLPQVQKCRELTSALRGRALLLVGQGKTDEAWQDLLACHRLARLVSRGATLIEGLVGFALAQHSANTSLAFLDQGKLTAKQIRRCLADLQKLPPLGTVADKVDLGERAIFLDSVQLVRRGGIGTLDGIGKELPAGMLDRKGEQALASIDWNRVMRKGNRWHGRLVKVMRDTDRGRREKQFDQIENDLKALKDRTAKDVENFPRLLKGTEPLDGALGEVVGNVMVGLMMPSARRMQHSSERVEQAGRNLQVAFALAAYREDNGRYPEKLSALAPKHLAHVPGDLFSGKGLIYRPSRAGYLLYSVGPNGQDEGGRYLDDEPRGDDPRVRMPLPPLKK